MRTTVTIDDRLFERAQHYTGITAKTELIRYAVKKLVQREAARALAEMGGTEPDLEYTPRRRDGQ